MAVSRSQPRVMAIVDATVEFLDAAIADQARLAVLLEARVAPGWEGFPASLVLLRDGLSGTGGWGPLLFIVDNPRTLIGLGGYYGPPSPEGIVEIGYAIAPSFQNQGWATEAVRLMIDRAEDGPDVLAIDARTLAEENASTAVLRKHGFTRIAEQDDPEDGPVWQWRRPSAWSSASPAR